MAGQCHRSDHHEFDPTPGGSGRPEGLACSGPWGHEESETTERLNNNNKLCLHPAFPPVISRDTQWPPHTLLDSHSNPMMLVLL